MKKILLALLLAASLLFSTSAMNVGAIQSNPTQLLVLGDSVASGYGLSTGESSYGNQLAAAFGLSTGNSKYQNLAVNGDTTDNFLAKLNDVSSTVASAVPSADTIVISIGGDDVLDPFISDMKTALGLSSNAANTDLEAAIAKNPTTAMTTIAATLNSTTVEAQFTTAVQTFATNYASIITAIRKSNSTANLYVQTIYNPFSGVAGMAALSTFTDSVLRQMNTVIKEYAPSANYKALDVYSAFSGKALTLTNIASFDIHPNEAGHTVIFNTAYTAITGEPYSTVGTIYSAHVKSIGWQKFVEDGAEVGTEHQSKRVEAVQIKLTGSLPAGAKITYQAHVQSKGWMTPVSNGVTAGTTGKSLRMEALRITLSSMSGYEVKYRAYVQGIGWMSWQTATNGLDISKAAVAGTTGKSLRLEALEIQIMKIS